MFRVRNTIFVCVSLKNFVIFLLFSPIYVKVAHFVSECCAFEFRLCGLECFVTWFMLHPLFCSVYFMIFNFLFFATFVIRYVCNRFVR